MRYLDEFRDPILMERIADDIARRTTKPWNIMEICGGQTHAIAKYGIERMLPAADHAVRLIHGPGCPVCVTPLAMIDRALALAALPDVIFTSFGDMLRVPGSECDLLTLRARGARVQALYSPLDALAIARKNPGNEVIFFAVGFETTAPGVAQTVYQAERDGIGNFSILVSHVLVPPAMEALLSGDECLIDGFLAAGHVCTVMGYHEYLPIAARYRVPIVVTGFEPLDILQGILMVITQLEEGRHDVENQYTRSVRSVGGNTPAQARIQEVFEVTDQKWRGIGEIPRSGLRLRDRYRRFDALERFAGIRDIETRESADCQAGLVLQGIMQPLACPMFGSVCTPEHPLGAPMVSSEGACAAYHRYRRTLD